MTARLCGTTMLRNLRSFVGCSGAALFFASLTFSVLAFPAHAQGRDALWTALRDGSAFALMRHARAPGTGDPPEFDLNDCATQRNLSEDGRRQAAAIGETFRVNGIVRARVFTSAWCRCRDTALLLNLGPVETLPALNSFFAARERKDTQTEAVKAWIAAASYDAPLILVTHQVNITALTGVYPGSGEVVVARLSPDGDITVLGTF